jgi:hypothetical protein
MKDDTVPPHGGPHGRDIARDYRFQFEQLTDHPTMDFHLRLTETKAEAVLWIAGRRYRMLGVRDEEPDASDTATPMPRSQDERTTPGRKGGIRRGHRGAASRFHGAVGRVQHPTRDRALTHSPSAHPDTSNRSTERRRRTVCSS